MLSICVLPQPTIGKIFSCMASYFLIKSPSSLRKASLSSRQCSKILSAPRKLQLQISAFCTLSWQPFFFPVDCPSFRISVWHLPSSSSWMIFNIFHTFVSFLSNLQRFKSFGPHKNHATWVCSLHQSRPLKCMLFLFLFSTELFPNHKGLSHLLGILSVRWFFRISCTDICFAAAHLSVRFFFCQPLSCAQMLPLSAPQMSSNREEQSCTKQCNMQPDLSVWWRQNCKELKPKPKDWWAAADPYLRHELTH